MNIQLKSPYTSIRLPGGTSSFGGSQMWARTKTLRKCGCGVVAAADILLYLSSALSPSERREWQCDEYCSLLEQLQRRYLPLIYPKGINGLLLVLGLNRLFHDRSLPFFAFWNVSGTRLIHHIEEMLLQDIPVILSIGPNFPLIWQKNSLTLYRPDQNGNPRPVTHTFGHYVTVCGVSDEWMIISSWGKQYLISIPEYREFVSKHSNYFFSNMVMIRKKAGT